MYNFYLYSYPQPNTYLYLLELESGSSILNYLNILAILFYTVLLHILILLCYYIWKWKKIHGKIRKLNEWMTFGHYIQFFMEIYLLLLFGSLSEIYYWRKDPKFVKSSSEISAFIILSFWVIMLFYSLWYWTFSKTIKGKKEPKPKRRKCEQWILGTKHPKLARLFTFMFFTRRLLLWVLVFIFVERNLYLKLWIYAIIQGIYMLMFTCIRPLEETKELLNEWINDIFYLILIVLLFFYNKIEDWSSLMKNIYIYLILANNLLTLILTLSKNWL